MPIYQYISGANTEITLRTHERSEAPNQGTDWGFTLVLPDQPHIQERLVINWNHATEEDARVAGEVELRSRFRNVRFVPPLEAESESETES